MFKGCANGSLYIASTVLSIAAYKKYFPSMSYQSFDASTLA